MSDHAERFKYVYENLMTRRFGWQSHRARAIREFATREEAAANAEMFPGAVVTSIRIPSNPDDRQEVFLALAAYGVPTADNVMRLRIDLKDSFGITEAVITVNVPELVLPPGRGTVIFTQPRDTVYGDMLRDLAAIGLITPDPQGLSVKSGHDYYPIFTTFLTIPTLPDENDD